MRLLVLPMLVVATGCAPALYLTRPTPPEGNLGSVRTMSVSVATNMGKAVEHSVVTGMVMGEIPIPVPVNQVVKSRFEAKLAELGYAVCPEAPCGDGAMTIEMLESSVNSQLTQSGVRATVRLKARVVVKQNDGQVPYDWNFWDTETGGAEAAPALVVNCADQLTARFHSTLLPGRQKSTLPLVDGGDLSPGVNMLLSSNWNGAIDYFTKLTQSQPENDGAWYDLGVAWEAYGDWGQALAAYEQAAARKRSRTYLDAVESARAMAPPPPAQQPVPQLIPPAQ
ncbi:MAG: tetratricopeptide repeat protein [Myxococcota bacterium]